MDFSAVALTEGQRAFAEEVRAFLDEHLTDEVRAGMRERSSTYDESLYLALGTDRKITHRKWARGSGPGPVRWPGLVRAVLG